MTVILDKPTAEVQPRAGVPGWHVVADLTPPELTAARRLHVLRNGIVLGLVAVAALCAAGAYLAGQKSDHAASVVAAANARTTTLNAERARYAKVTQIEDAVTAAKTQQASLLATDVDMAKLIVAIARATPQSVDPSSVNVSLNPPSGVPTTGDTSTVPIATVTLTGTAHRLTDVADYVQNLNATRGFLAVLPSTNSKATGNTSNWTLTFQLSDAWYSHRFVAPTPTTSTSASTVSGGN